MEKHGIKQKNALRSVRYLEIDSANGRDNDEWDMVSCRENCSVVRSYLEQKSATRTMKGGRTPCFIRSVSILSNSISTYDCFHEEW